MLRAILETDLPAIRDINDFALGYPVSIALTKQQFDKLSQNPDHFIIGFEDSHTHTLVGYVHAESYESLYSPSGLNILALAVLPNYQGQGIGRQLLQALEQKAKSLGFSFIRLNSASHRTEAHAFYRKLNYSGDKTQLRFLKEL